jgi:hypothetical protein
MYRHDNWLSLEEIITTLLPIIEEVAGTELEPTMGSKNKTESLAFAVLVAAFKTERPAGAEEPIESIVRMLSRLKAKASPT